MHNVPLFLGIDFKIKTIELQGKKIKLQIWYVCLIACLVTLMLLYCIVILSMAILRPATTQFRSTVTQWRYLPIQILNLSRTAKHVRSRNRKAKTLHKSEAKHGP